MDQQPFCRCKYGQRVPAGEHSRTVFAIRTLGCMFVSWILRFTQTMPVNKMSNPGSKLFVDQIIGGFLKKANQDKPQGTTQM